MKIICLLLALPLLSVDAISAASLTAVEARIAAGQDAQAVASLKDIVAKDHDDFQAWFMLGVTQARLRNFKDAEVSFQQVVRLRPELAEPHNNLAVIYNEQGELTAAIRELEASLKLNPEYSTAYENIGDLYIKLAARSYRNALEKQENPALRMRYDRLLHIRDHQGQAMSAPAPAAPIHRNAAQTPDVAAPVSLATRDVAAKPVEPMENSVTSAENEVKDALETWRNAWSQQDLATYFAAYADDFAPSRRFSSIRSWQQYKRKVIGMRNRIEVTLENVVVMPDSTDRMRAVFKQHFRSDGYRSDDLKTLEFKQTLYGWKIIRETTN